MNGEEASIIALPDHLEGRVRWPSNIPHLEWAILRRLDNVFRVTPGLVDVLDHHSFVNILSAVELVLTLLGVYSTGDMRLLSESMTRFEQIREAGYGWVNWGEFEKSIWNEISEKIRRDVPLKNPKKYSEQVSILTRIFGILGIRARELALRNAHPDDFSPISEDEILADLKMVFWAMAECSDGKYGIVFDVQNKRENDYLFQIVIANYDPNRPGVVAFPSVFSDIFRDMLANARKYSPIGSIVRGSIQEFSDRLLFSVSDAWYGIPEDAFDHLWEPGYRAQNIREIIPWHGYGLAKMRYYVQKFWGTTLVRSKEWVGSEFIVILPKPKN